MPLLKVENLNSFFGEVQVLWDVGIQIRKGEIVSMVGANGAGKSTMMRTISGILRPKSGNIFFKDTLLNELGDSSNYVSTFITNPLMESLEFLKEIASHMGANFAPEATKLEIKNILENTLRKNMVEDRHSIVIIDESHLITKQETWEELRLLLNLQFNNRFLLSLRIGYPSTTEEEKIALSTSGPEEQLPDKASDIADMVALAREVPAPPHVISYAVKVVRATRPEDGSSTVQVKEFVRWGAGPRASQHLLLAAKARAILEERFAVTREDVRRMTKPVLRHRLVLRFNAVSEGVHADEVLNAVLETIPGE